MISKVFSPNYNNISFGSVMRTVYNNNNTENIKYRNNTSMFRIDLDWNLVIDKIVEGEMPRKIYCYACSDGSEPYSIAIGLISKLGWNKAQKYFPIIAKDVDEKMINLAKTGKINLSEIDTDKIKTYQEEADVKFFESISPKYNEDEFGFIGKISDKLRECVQFDVGDICDDARDFDYNNTVIFFRNAMPYLPKEKRDMLLATFARNLNDKTAIVIGEYDKTVLKAPLWTVQNNTFGLFQPAECFYQGARLKNMRKFRLTCLDYDYILPLFKYSAEQKEKEILENNKFNKFEITNNNRHVANRRSNSIRKY